MGVSDRFTAFCDPYSGHEILISTTENLGIVYHPRKIGEPRPWRAGCPHCIEGRQGDLPLAIKRQIKLLCTRTTTNRRSIGFAGITTPPVVQYEVPSNSKSFLLTVQRGSDDVRAIVTGGGRTGLLEVIHRPKAKDKYIGHHRSFQSDILHRSLTFLFSERVPSKSEVRAVLTPLIKRQRHDGIPVGNHHLCRKIDWQVIVSGSP